MWHVGALDKKITFPISWSMKLRIQLSHVVTFGLALWSVLYLFGVKWDCNNEKAPKSDKRHGRNYAEEV